MLQRLKQYLGIPPRSGLHKVYEYQEIGGYSIKELRRYLIDQLTNYSLVELTDNNSFNLSLQKIGSAFNTDEPLYVEKLRNFNIEPKDRYLTEVEAGIDNIMRYFYMNNQLMLEIRGFNVYESKKTIHYAEIDWDPVKKR